MNWFYQQLLRHQRPDTVVSLELSVYTLSIPGSLFFAHDFLSYGVMRLSCGYHGAKLVVVHFEYKLRRWTIGMTYWIVGSNEEKGVFSVLSLFFSAPCCLISMPTQCRQPPSLIPPVSVLSVTPCSFPVTISKGCRRLVWRMAKMSTLSTVTGWSPSSFRTAHVSREKKDIQQTTGCRQGLLEFSAS